MGKLFAYFKDNASYEVFSIKEFMKIQNCPTKSSSIEGFKKFINSVVEFKSKQEAHQKARAFARQVQTDGFGILEQAEFIDYWRLKEQALTRSKLRVIEDEQTKNHVRSYNQIFGSSIDNDTALNSSPGPFSDDDDSGDLDYQSRESTPSSTSSNDNDTSSRKFYLVHDGDSYEYKLKNDASRWIVNNTYDVSEAFFKYRDESKSKAEDLEQLNNHEQLSLDGIILIDNDFVKNDIVDFEQIDGILDDIDNQEYFQQTNLPPQKKLFLSTFAEDMGKRRINSNKIRADVEAYKQSNEPDTGILCFTLGNLLNTYTTDYSTETANEATLVRDTIDSFFKPYFPNSALTRSISADSMMRDSSDRFTRLDPSLVCCGKRADFSVVSIKSSHALLSLEAKSNKTKNIDELVKLCRELKDSTKGIHKDGHGNVPVCGILMKGISCQVYVMDHKFDGLYRVVLVGKFDLPQDCYGMQNLVSIIPVFEKLKAIVHSSATILRARPAAGLRIPEDIVSMHTPTSIRVAKRNLDKKDPHIKHARRKLRF